MEHNEHIKELMLKFLSRKCSEEEIARLLEYFKRQENEISLKASIKQYFEEEAEQMQGDSAAESKAIEEVHARLMVNIKEKQAKVRYIKRFRYSAAASILVLLGLTAWYYFIYTGSKDTLVLGSKLKGGTKEILDYLDTTRMPISNRRIETIAGHETSAIKSNNRNGQLAISEAVKVGNISYNRVTIPRGGQYQLTLPDNTKVWLNSGSTIAFPGSFTEGERRVKVTGEAYFEVAQLEQANGKGKIPFIAAVGDKAEIKVLGTHFNINSFAEDNGAVKVTLLEGSVEVLALATNQLSKIKPGEQAIISTAGTLNVKEANLEEVMAWKNGYFYFNNTSLKNIMRQLARWYDVKVLYYAETPERNFSGKINKDLSLNEVIEVLSYTHVNISVNDSCIMVRP